MDKVTLTLDEYEVFLRKGVISSLMHAAELNNFPRKKIRVNVENINGNITRAFSHFLESILGDNTLEVLSPYEINNLDSVADKIRFVPRRYRLGDKNAIFQFDINFKKVKRSEMDLSKIDIGMQHIMWFQIEPILYLKYIAKGFINSNAELWNNSVLDSRTALLSTEISKILYNNDLNSQSKQDKIKLFDCVKYLLESMESAGIDISMTDDEYAKFHGILDRNVAGFEYAYRGGSPSFENCDTGEVLSISKSARNVSSLASLSNGDNAFVSYMPYTTSSINFHIENERDFQPTEFFKKFVVPCAEITTKMLYRPLRNPYNIVHLNRFENVADFASHDFGSFLTKYRIEDLTKFYYSVEISGYECMYYPRSENYIGVNFKDVSLNKNIVIPYSDCISPSKLNELFKITIAGALKNELEANNFNN